MPNYLVAMTTNESAALHDPNKDVTTANFTMPEELEEFEVEADNVEDAALQALNKLAAYIATEEVRIVMHRDDYATFDFENEVDRLGVEYEVELSE